MKLTTFDEFRAQFRDFYHSVKTGHENTKKQSHGGHGIDHDITVAMIAVKISDDERIGQKAWCAAMLHSVDRVVGASDIKDTMMKHAEYLKHFFSQNEIDEIIEAAFRHSERNQIDQSETQITLMDADRLANMQSAVIIRSGQFRPDIPVFDFKYLSGAIDPLSTYEDPKSVIDDLRLCIINYIPQLRNKEAKHLGNIYAEKLNAYIRSIEDENEYFGLTNIEI
ncbi:MAG: HD domain-containing protein [Candidatus Paceibacterota bacterium]|jgi:hypothetical protein